MRRERSTTTAALMALAGVTLMTLVSCTRTAPAPSSRSFATPEDAVRALVDAAKAGQLEDVARDLRTRRTGARRLLRSGDRPPQSRRVHGRGRRGMAARRRGRASARCSSSATRDGRFRCHSPRVASGWRFDTAAGKEEVLDRRIGRNELAVIRICRTYVAAQRLYAERGHDGQPAGLYATNVLERSGPRERTLLARGARPDAQSAG